MNVASAAAPKNKHVHPATLSLFLFSCQFSVLSQRSSPTARKEAVRRNVGSHRRGLPVTVRVAMRSAQTERRAEVRFHYNWWEEDVFCLFVCIWCQFVT